MPSSLAYEVHRSQHFVRKLQHLSRWHARALLRDGVRLDAHEFWEALEELEAHMERMSVIAYSLLRLGGTADEVGAAMAGVPEVGDDDDEDSVPTRHIDGGFYCDEECNDTRSSGQAGPEPKQRGAARP